MKTSLLIFALTIPAALWADPTIAPTGWNLYLNMGPNNNDGINADYVTVSGVSGGRFEGRLGASSTSTANSNVNLWCVDAQLYFNSNGSYRANSLGFGQIDGESAPGNNWTNGPSGSRDVRYEDVVGTNHPNAGTQDNFLNSLGIGIFLNGASDGAKFRYRMAGYLLDQYEANNSNLGTQVELTGNAIGQGKYDPKNSARNQAILGAIWSAMDTEGDGPDQPALSDDRQVWFNKAAAYVNTYWTSDYLWSKWAVVSGWSGDTYVQNAGGPVQTFLTETPEPGFYGFLCTGLSALAWAANRRKKNNGIAV